MPSNVQDLILVIESGGDRECFMESATKKRVGFNLKIFVFALLKTVHCRAERNPGRLGRLFNCMTTSLDDR